MKKTLLPAALLLLLAACSEASVAAVKNMVSAASTAFESMQKAVKQAADMAQNNFNTMASNATAPAGKASRSSKA